jgi:DNA-binding transcriptional ArsR family regulator
MMPLSDSELEIIAQRFRAMGDATRLALLQALGERELSVGDLVKATGRQQANVSRHLNAMTQAGLLSRRKSGTHVFYSVADSRVFLICKYVCAGLDEWLGGKRRPLAEGFMQ